jgi:hypothetical protein
VKVGNTINQILIFLPPSWDFERVIVSPPIEVFEDGCTL